MEEKQIEQTSAIDVDKINSHLHIDIMLNIMRDKSDTSIKLDFMYSFNPITTRSNILVTEGKQRRDRLGL